MKKLGKKKGVKLNEGNFLVEENEREIFGLEDFDRREKVNFLVSFKREKDKKKKKKKI